MLHLAPGLIAAALPGEARPQSRLLGPSPDALADAFAVVVRGRPHPAGVRGCADGALMWQPREYAVGQVVPARPPAHARRFALTDPRDRDTPEVSAWP